MHEKARFFLVCMFPFSFCLLDFTAQLFFSKAVLKIFAKTYFENRFFKEHLRRSYGRQRGCSPHQRGSQYPIFFQLNSQISTQLHPYKAKMFHLPPCSVFPASDFELFVFALCESFAIAILAVFFLSF